MNIKRLLLSWVALVVGCVTAVAQLPTATTIVEGQFAPDTKWYTLQIAEQGYLISDQGTANYISLNRTVGVQNKDLWCFVGDNTTGYTIYNKQKGTQFKLATPSNATVAANAESGLTAYTIVKGIGAEDMGDYRHLWKFAASTHLGGNGFFMHPADNANQRINKRGDKLAYWNGGADAGSTVKIVPVEQEMNISITTGTLYRGTATGQNWNNKWESTSNTPRLTLMVGANNMSKEGNNLILASGSSQNATYTLSVPTGYTITGYSFEFKNKLNEAGVNVIVNGQTLTSNFSQWQTIGHANIDGNKNSVTFTLQGPNKPILLQNFKVQIARAIIPEEPWFEVFDNKTTQQVPYRIPAIATAKNGHIIAVADYRYTRQDIGMGNPKGKLDIRARISTDNGTSWGEIFTIAQGNDAVTGFHKAFGDPCLVADRESNKILMLTCAGDVSFFDGTRDYHQGVARFVSENNGAQGSWSQPEDITEQFYAQLDGAARGPLKALFIGSGKIHQSRYTKKDGSEYYRLYAATIARDKNGTFANYVYYSDDFGKVWTLLGDKDTPAISTGDSNEPKVEELPDGSVIISSRPVAGGAGRIYNVFKFTNSQEGKGSWGTFAYSGSSNSGTITTSNSTNGEILIVPAKRVSDGARTYVAFQSVPLGPNRANVGIYFKELNEYSKYSNAATFSANWDGVYQASYMGSAYSTMTLQNDGNIGFLYEEDTYGVNSGGGYNIVYKNYSIEKLTGNRFTKPDFDEDTALAKEFETVKAAFRGDIDASNVAVGTEANRYFVMPSSVIDEANTNYNAATYPASDVAAQKAAIRNLFDKIEAFHASMESGFRTPKHGDKIHIQNSAYPTLNLAVNADMQHLVGIAANDHRTVWVLEETTTKGIFHIYNPYLNRYIAPAPTAYETTFDVVAHKEKAGRYEFLNPAAKLAAISQFGSNGNSSIHFKTTGNPVRWVAQGSPASQFVITINEAEFNADWTANLRTDVNTIATLTENAANTLRNNGANIGTALGQFHIDQNAISSARAMADFDGSDQPDLTEAIKKLDNAVGYNMPQPGFYRFKGSVSNKYIDGVTAHTGGHAMMNAEAGQNANGIFYFTHDNQLVSFGTGLCLANSWGFEGFRSNANTLTFGLPNNAVANQGKYTLYTGSWIYDNGNTANKNWIDRNGTYAANNCDWFVEPVSAIPVEVATPGLATIYSPVDLRIPEGVKAYQGMVNTENTELTLTEVTDGVIRAFTPVVIEAAANTYNFQVVERSIDANEENPAIPGTIAFIGSIYTQPKTGNALTLQHIDNESGFYNFTGTNLKGFHAFVQWDDTTPTQGLRLNFGSITAIDALNALTNEAPAAIYDLQGRRHKTLQKGINLVNGKKVFVQ